MALTEQAVDLLHIFLPSLKLASSSYSSVLVLVYWRQDLLWEALCEGEYCYNPQRKDIDGHVVPRLIFESFWRHVDRRARCLGHGGYPQAGHNASHAKVSYLGRHGGAQQNVPR